MEKHDIMDMVGQLVGALVMAAILVLGTAYAVRVAIVEPSLAAQTEILPEGPKTVINK
jgi:hypothetical protein